MKNELSKRVLSSIIIIPITIFLTLKGSFYFVSMLYIFFILAFIEWQKIANNKNYFLPGLLFLKISFILTYILREKFGVDFFLFLIFICISTDVGGYFFGKILKGPKLTRISPNKTYAGLIGGYSLAFFASYLFSNNIDVFFIFFDYKFKDVVVITFLISSISQIGDIIVSYFKRLTNFKNTGNIIPGHGGILDRIDGMIFVIPLITLILLFV